MTLRKYLFNSTYYDAVATILRLEIGKGIDEGAQHSRDIYNAILNLGKPTVKEIEQYVNSQYEQENQRLRQGNRNGGKYWIDKLKLPIGLRTIQRCIKKHPKIKRDGWRYFIDPEAISEKRYLQPDRFGHSMYNGIFGWAESFPSSLENRRPWPDYLKLRWRIIELGVFLVYSFIEAARPLRDQLTNPEEIQHEVNYWVKNCIPVETMFRDVVRIFEGKKIKGNGSRFQELDEKSVKDAFETLEKAYPEYYKLLKDRYDTI